MILGSKCSGDRLPPRTGIMRVYLEDLGAVAYKRCIVVLIACEGLGPGFAPTPQLPGPAVALAVTCWSFSQRRRGMQ